MERPLAADARVAIEFGAKRFKLRNPDAVVNEHELFRSFCNEVTAYCVVAASPLLELPVTFSPSYNYDPEELVEGSRGKLRRGTSIGEKGETCSRAAIPTTAPARCTSRARVITSRALCGPLWTRHSEGRVELR